MIKKRGKKVSNRRETWDKVTPILLNYVSPYVLHNWALPSTQTLSWYIYFEHQGERAVLIGTNPLTSTASGHSPYIYTYRSDVEVAR